MSGTNWMVKSVKAGIMARPKNSHGNTPWMAMRVPNVTSPYYEAKTLMVEQSGALHLALHVARSRIALQWRPWGMSCMHNGKSPD